MAGPAARPADHAVRHIRPGLARQGRGGLRTTCRRGAARWSGATPRRAVEGGRVGLGVGAGFVRACGRTMGRSRRRRGGRPRRDGRRRRPLRRDSGRSGRGRGGRPVVARLETLGIGAQPAKLRGVPFGGAGRLARTGGPQRLELHHGPAPVTLDPGAVAAQRLQRRPFEVSGGQSRQCRRLDPAQPLLAPGAEDELLDPVLLDRIGGRIAGDEAAAQRRQLRLVERGRSGSGGRGREIGHRGHSDGGHGRPIA